ncbi:STAS domain-containing protein [Marinactinospora thermotolerans]|uniref:Anti-sigma factor antagonist n=1 Tax=Marinactinospora thermotolerans DSM 45154 TaxID=1122192 RepID=A0A1T4K1B7_9ACTN|nr:STAS domain-containing protein [Marinactinospora thermotolerans]SJZ36183.1 anti-sigma B factor antagonist [Marinactinospora thermotolerans DSM 45154]
MFGRDQERFPCGDAVVVEVHGEIDLATAGDLGERLLAAASREGCACLVVDLSRVRFFDASGVRTLMAVYRILTRAGRHMVLAEPSGPARRTLDALAMEQVFDIYPIVEAALTHGHDRLGGGSGRLDPRR